MREGALGPDIVSSVYASREKDDPAIRELLALHIFAGNLEKKINGIELTPEEYDRLQVVAGAGLRQALDARVNIEGWSQLPEFVQCEATEKAITTSRAQARKAITLTPAFLQRKLDKMQKDLDTKAGQIH